MTLEQFFYENPSGALAFSGGTDSALLVWAAKKYGKDWHAYYVETAFQPAFELADARKIASECELPLTIIKGDIMKYHEVTENPSNRCYMCKRVIFTMLLKQAQADGYKLIIDGTNASDDASDRPGMRALQELGVRSPLKECGLTKDDVRLLCREAGLFVWNKPSYACLATRIPAGTEITQDALKMVERGENLLSSLGFIDFRIRLHGQAAIIQVSQGQFSYAIERRADIERMLKPIFPIVAIDLEPRKKN